MRNSSSFSRSHSSLQETCSCCTSRFNLKFPWNPKEFSKVRSVCPITEPAIGAAGVTSPASSAVARATSWLALHWDSLSAFPLHARGWAVPRKSVVGALRTLELLLRHLEQARTSLAALAPAICPLENCCGRTGRHPLFPCNLPSVPVRH